MKDRDKGGQSHIIQDSFRLKEQPEGLDRETIVRLGSQVSASIKGEIISAAEALNDFDNYESLLRRVESGENLSPDEARKIAFIEASALFLTAPIGLNLDPNAIEVYRNIRMLEAAGILKRGAFSGNILLVGSGYTRHEVQGLNAKVIIEDPENYQKFARLYCDILLNLPIDSVEELAIAEMATKPFSGVMSECVGVTARLSNTQKIVAVEPSERLIEGYKYNSKVFNHALDNCNVKLEQTTLGEYLDVPEKESFSLIMFRRTDPLMWTNAFQSFSKDDMKQLMSGRTENKVQFAKKVNEVKRQINLDVGSLLRLLGKQMDTGSQLLVSVGSGNDNVEFVQRGLFLNQIGDYMQGLGMEVNSLDIIAMHDLKLVAHEEDSDCAITVASSTEAFRKRIGLRENGGIGSPTTENQRKKGRRRHH